MARTTRSAAVLEKNVLEKPAEIVVNKPTKPTKKRKRMSNGDSDAPAAKHPRSDDEQDEEDIDLKEENEERGDVGTAAVSSTIYPPLAGESSLREADARKILDILELCDTQGLLDRVFPLHDEAPGSSSPSPSPASKPPQDSASLRAMLQEPDEHSLKALRSAVNQLFPISSQPRSRTSPTAEQQLRFCQLALSLLDQASERTIDVQQINQDILFPDNSPEEAGSSSRAGLAPERRRKYALMQTLPSGEWWTSLNSESTGSDSLPLTELSTANADLVSILPAPSSSSGPVSTLGDLTFAKKSQPVKPKLPGARRIKGGHFLDYGPYASFAPSFDSEGAEVGRFGMGQFLWMRLEKGKAKERAKLLKQKLQQKIAASQQTISDEILDLTMNEGPSIELDSGDTEKEQKASSSECSGTETSDAIASILDRLGLEEGVAELLAKNSKALIRLEELQARRYGERGGSSEKVSPEERELAQNLTDSFALLASLKPRLPSELKSAIIPSTSVLRSLHRTLPSNTNNGWYGTLAEGRKTALHDDTTIYMSSIPQPAPPPVSTTPLVPTPAQAAPPGTPNYNAQYGHQYNSYPHQYRGTYQTPGYYANSSYQGASPAPSYSAAGYPAQHQAQYGWQQNYSKYGGGSGTTSGRGTPQPQASGVPAPYGQYPPPGLATPLPARAVANTVTGAKSNMWGSVGMPSTLPPHMRAAAGSPAVGMSSPLAAHSYGHSAMPAFQHAPSTPL
ncbi:hypothetical protein SCHPADRAFT_923686 [Schizopora paradoxa]|uniref:Uncharacterized protein n=1 Tax=Schizopora paradoxa TaxID=27342 RepID=A0A0H2S8D1_9AGAM|nr:hypothetical protein SCHPADRAFT_923686 [Schizopora paradoxa]